MSSDWTYTATNFTINYPQSATISVTPSAAPKPKRPLEWLRDQVDEVCALAREP